MKRFTFLACAAMMAYTASAATTVHEGSGMSGADAYTEMSFNYLGSEAGDHPDLTAKVVYTLTPTADNHLDVTAEFIGLDASKFIGLVDACYVNINGETPMTLTDGKYTATTTQTYEEGQTYNGFFKRMSSAAWYGGDLLFNFSFTYSSQTTGEDYAPEHLYIIGQVNDTNNNPLNGVEMTRNGNSYTITATVNDSNAGNGYFFFSPERSNDWDNVLAKVGYGAAANNTPVTLGESTVLTTGKNSFMLPAGEYDFTVTFAQDGVTMLVEKPLKPVDIWNNANARVAEIYYAPGWSPMNDKAVYSFTGGALKVELPEATTDRWQAQFKIDTDLAMNADEVYDVEFDVLSTTSFTACTKLTQKGDDNNFYFEDNLPLVADQVYHFSKKGLTGKNISPAQLIFDFGTNPANTTLDVTNIRLIKYVNEGEEPVVVEVPEHLYIIGQVNDTNYNPLNGVEMTRNGNTFTLTATVNDSNAGNGYFFFSPERSDDWDNVLAKVGYGAAANDTPVTLGESTVLTTGKNSFMLPAGEYDFTVTFAQDGVTMLVEKEGPVVPATKPFVILPAGKTDATVINTTYYDWWQAGGIAQSEGAYGDLENATVYTFTATGDGSASGGWDASGFDFASVFASDYDLVFSIRSTSAAKTFVKLAVNGKEQETPFEYTNDGEWQTVRMNLKEKFPTVVENNDMGVGNGYVFSFVAGEGLVKGDKFDLTDVCYVLKGEERPGYIMEQPAGVPEKLYIIGTIAGSSWTPEATPEMTKEGNIFTIDVTLDNGANTDSYFSFIPVLGDWATINQGMRYGAVNENLFALDAPQTLVAAPGEASAFHLDYTGEATVTADFDAMTVTVTKKTDSIDTIGADSDASAVYYNLNGIRVDNPRNGLFIRKQGNTVTKVLVK